MSDMITASEVTGLASLLAPGMLILGIRARFKDGSIPEIKDRIVGYGIASTAYYAAISPLFNVRLGVEISAWLWGLAQFFVVPCIVGSAIVWFDQSEWFYKICAKLKLVLAHHTPTAWDFAFRKRVPSYALVHLTDGSTVAGAWTEGSFASTTSSERDLFLSQMWSVQSDGTGWTVVDPPRSILICGANIRVVEFITGGSS